MSHDSAQLQARRIFESHEKSDLQNDESLRDMIKEAARQDRLYSLMWFIKWHAKDLIGRVLAVIPTLEFRFTGAGGDNREGEFLAAVFAAAEEAPPPPEPQAA